MYKISPKIITLVLLLVAVAPVLLFTGFFIKQKHIQLKMHERLEKTALHTINANVADVKWVKKNKEVEIHGRMFDIKHFEINGNQITLTGLYDEEEHELKKELAGLLKQKKNGTEPLNQLVLKITSFTAVINTTAFSAPLFTPLIKVNYPPHSEELLHQSMAVATPPPNFV